MFDVVDLVIVDLMFDRFYVDVVYVGFLFGFLLMMVFISWLMFLILVMILLLGCVLVKFLGVLVRIMLLGLSVMKLENYVISVGMLKIMLCVLFFCVIWLLMVVCSVSCIGLGILLWLMSYGLIGV